MVKEGTLWGSSDGKKFRVLDVTEVDSHIWVHYREDYGFKTPPEGCREYSCYEESFLLRFTPQPE